MDPEFIRSHRVRTSSTSLSETTEHNSQLFLDPLSVLGRRLLSPWHHRHLPEWDQICEGIRWFTVGLSLGENQHINHHAEIGENYDKIET